jgi:hypothetical protein
MKNGLFRSLLLLAAASLTAVAAPIVTVNPAFGDIQTLPGGSGSWGFTITNPSADNVWLVFTSINHAPAAVDGTMSAPNFLLPFMAPGDVDAQANVYTFTWNAGAPIYTLATTPNAGTFQFLYEVYAGDPDMGGTLVSADNLLSASYRISNDLDNGGGGPVIPEPSTYAMLGGGLAAVAFFKRRASK